MQTKCDILVIGSGIAGLSYAIKSAKLLPEIKICVLSKAALNYSNTNFAQGGIATVTNLLQDSFEAHIEDTLKSGDGLSTPSIVKLVVETAPERLEELVEYGVGFTYSENGTFDLALEGGHSSARVVHAFDNTGEHIENALIKTAQSFDNISFFENRFCIDILKTESGKASGVSALNLNTHKIELFFSKIVVLASGGSGQVYKNTTNPSVATGDGTAMGIKAGAMVSNLNFVQFHPTAFYEKDKTQLDLITEAIRGFGAYIINKDGNRFLFNYDPRGELATRDIVSTAIFNELKESGENCVYLDCRHFDEERFQNKFPKVYSNLSSKNINITSDLIPIVPAAHYQCGGLKVNEKGQTNINGLYAIGECAETGLHGANRLASNSLLEALVFAHETAEWTSFTINDIVFEEPEIEEMKTVCEDNDETYKNSIKEIQSVMGDYATIASTVSDLNIAKIKLDEINEFLRSKEDHNCLSKSSLIANNLWINADEIVKSKIKNKSAEKIYV